MKRYIFPLFWIFAFAALMQSCKGPLPQELIPPAPAYCLEEGSEFLIPLIDSCRTQPFARMGNIWIPPEEQKYLYHRPLFSRQDNNEVLYLRYQTDTSATDQLWSINICTGEKRLITKDCMTLVSQSANGWIAFGTGRGVWKIKTNGDSLTQLQTLLIEFDWHPSGQQMIGLTIDNKWALLNSDGQIISMLPFQAHHSPKWSPDGEHITFHGFTSLGSFVYLYHVPSQQINQIPVRLKYSHSFWIDNNHLLIPHSSGDLVKLNIHTRQIVEVIKPACTNLEYNASSLSADGQFLLCWYKINEEITPGSSLLRSYSKLIVMNPDGSNEREIVLE